MKTKLLISIQLILAVIFCFGCMRTKDDVWDDTKSAGRHVQRGFRSLAGKHGDSRQVRCREEFSVYDEEYSFSPEECDYVPLQDLNNDNLIAMADVSRHPKYSPGDPGSAIPGIDAFYDPATYPELAGIFESVRFPYNSNLIKGEENLLALRKVANYLKKHDRVYVFIEGHCDERGAEAYNLALGSRRSNAVREILIKEGVNPENLFTISYGKERPLFLDHNEESWGQNRRAEFKIYQR
ncbi:MULTISPECIES: OmpA family protein [Parachlamydia]|jgi:peptidoglycan-associated lipoprotein|uniref:Peptidoglycan-associated protein n=2 Tax=Parachlamydia acanthamoebae TaxID=83552 RepID=F8KUZ4_PARAV|nr:OmpA family protein [Parachlamydia acanthamoebae]EFB41244.1 hypothetical protein pah_c048o071 [Parachlamydia acanthamoebae str. Hall's coccus]KIA76441.1 Peptidoglycan-associated lipoprotein [Parachlamydia acanthamoebae]CCB85060.1 peptidoglycan-associated lipoprotein [Parachlamydia acanthamoebae UV-7]